MIKTAIGLSIKKIINLVRNTFQVLPVVSTKNKSNNKTSLQRFQTKEPSSNRFFLIKLKFKFFFLLRL